jgi:hypothetical protein
MAEYLKENLKAGEATDKDTIIRWFRENYPKIKSNTIWCHIVKFTTNHRTRVHYSATPKNDYLFQLPDKSLRLYNPETDPKPIYTLDDPPPEVKVSPEENGTSEFAYESHLRDYLKDHLHIIEPGLKLYRDEEDDTITGVEFECGGRRLDILAVDRERNYVVIELKVSRGYDRTIGQLLRYRAWVRKELANGSRVRGIIIAKSISPDLKMAADEIDGIDLYEYDLSIELRKA